MNDMAASYLFLLFLQLASATTDSVLMVTNQTRNVALTRIFEALEDVADNFTKPEALSVSPTISPTKHTADKDRPNLLFIMADQMRFDAMRHVQDRLKDYTGAKILTPNLDRLAKLGVDFSTAYCVFPSCGPARTSLRSGSTIQRTGVQGNKLVRDRVYLLDDKFAKKVEAIETYEQLLTEKRGYVAETYGKWHLPLRLYYESDVKWKKNKSKRGAFEERRVIASNTYDYRRGDAGFEEELQFKHFYRKALSWHIHKNGLKPVWRKGQQKNFMSSWPYTPIKLDARYGMKPGTALKSNEGMEKFERGEASVIGRDSLPAECSTTGIVGDMSLRSLDRLLERNDPWSLTVSFLAPHPPSLANAKLFDYYYRRKSKLFVSKSYKDPMVNSPYVTENGRQKLLEAGYGYNDKKQLQEWVAVYYAMVTEVDVWVGRFLDRLEASDAWKNTLIVFTADHGELLGAHSMRGKSTFHEEASRVPLIIAFPGAIKSGKLVKEPVSHLDVFATIMDYLNAGNLDKSDGQSLRRFIEDANYNRFWDDEAVVVEIEKAVPKDNELGMSKKLGEVPNYMVRSGPWKLSMTKLAQSKTLDQLFNLEKDPYEMNNLVGKLGRTAPDEIIGKAEHLKCLLMEWMRRMDGDMKYYSRSRYNFGQGRGDIHEIRLRRQWRLVDYWQSDTRINFGKPVKTSDQWKRNEFFYIGRTKPGVLRITDIRIIGKDARYFSINKRRAELRSGDSLRIRVSFQGGSNVQIKKLDAALQIHNNVNGVRRVPLTSGREEQDQ